MLIHCARSQFFDVLLKRAPHVLIICSDDVDALCAAAILQHALVIEHKAFTLRYARNAVDLRTIVSDYANQLSYKVLINCGGILNLDEHSLGDHHVLFVIDSLVICVTLCFSMHKKIDITLKLRRRRPFDLENVYDADRIRILVRPDEVDTLKIPRYEDVVEEESDGDDEENDAGAQNGQVERTVRFLGSGINTASTERHDSDQDLFEQSDAEGSARNEPSDADSPVVKKSRQKKSALMGAVEKRDWEKRRADLLWEYYELVHYATPSSLLMYDLVYRLSLATVDLCWIAIVGATSLFLEGKWNKEEYMSLCAGELRQIGRVYDQSGNSASQIDAMRIQFRNDVWLPLYEHWSLFECVQHCTHAFAQLRLWSQDGQHNLLRFFADLGLPLGECRQIFPAMSREVRSEAVDAFRERAGLWKLNDIVTGVYVLHFSYSHHFSALEVAAAIGALLHFASPSTQTENGADAHLAQFDKAAGALQKLVLDGFLAPHTLDVNFFVVNPILVQFRTGVQTLYAGIDLYKQFLGACVREATVALLQGHIIHSGPFLHLHVNAGADSAYLSGAHSLYQLGRFVLRAYRRRHQTNKARNNASGLPLVLTAAAIAGGDENAAAWYLVCGVVPLEAESMMDKPKTLMPRAFERTAEKLACTMHSETFDNTVVRIRSENRLRFLDCLMLVLHTESVR